MTSNPQILLAYNGFVMCLFLTLTLTSRVTLCVSHDLLASILELRGSPQLGHATVMVKGEESLASHALALEASAQNDNVAWATFHGTHQICHNEPGGLTLPRDGSAEENLSHP